MDSSINSLKDVSNIDSHAFSVTNLRIKCVIAFAIVSSIAISLAAIQHQGERIAKTDANHINLAGRQRMLSQRLAKQLILASTDNHYQRASDRDLLLATWNQFETGHNTVVAGKQATAPTPEMVEQLYVVNHTIGRVAEYIQSYLLDRETAETHIRAKADEIRRVLDNLEHYLQNMDALVFAWSEQSRSRTVAMQRVTNTHMIAVVVVVVLSGFLLIEPAIRTLKQSHRQVLDSKLALTEHAEIHQAVFEYANNAILVVDESGVVRQANPAAYKVFRTNPTMLLGESVVKLIPVPACRGQRNDNQTGAIDRAGYRATIVDKQIPAFRLNGDRFTCEITTSSFHHRDGKHHFYFVRDIEQKLQEEQRSQLSRKLESLGSLAAGIAHEINNPLQCVSGNIEFLGYSLSRLSKELANLTESEGEEGPSIQDEALSSKLAELKSLVDGVDESVADATEAIGRVTEIIGAMNALALPSSTDAVRVDVNQVVKNVATVTKNTWKYHAKLNLDLDDKMPSTFGYSSQMSQALVNIVMNASEAILQQGHETPDTGRIDVRTRFAEDELTIEIEDNGCGMTKETQSRAFDPFFTTKPAGEGTGQGLSIAYDLIAGLHKGRVEIASQVGRGTTVTITLPLVESAPECDADLEFAELLSADNGDDFSKSLGYSL